MVQRKPVSYGTLGLHQIPKLRGLLEALRGLMVKPQGPQRVQSFTVDL
jgi:hypothetical protein